MLQEADQPDLAVDIAYANGLAIFTNLQLSFMQRMPISSMVR
jgi:hypothetical protein